MFHWKRQKQSDHSQTFIGLDDKTLAVALRRTFEEQAHLVGALFLVAYENFPVYFGAYAHAMKKDSRGAASLENLAIFLNEQRAKYPSESVHDQYSSRRLFYLQLAALLKTLHQHAASKPALWDPIAAIWVALLPGARALRKTIDSTLLWTKDEVAYFVDVGTENEGESYCLSQLVPKEIRWHHSIQEWEERNVTPELKAVLDRADELFRAE